MGQKELEKLKATFWDSKELSIGDKFSESLGGSQSLRTSPEDPRTSPDPRLPRRSTPFSGKPDALS